MQIKVLMSPLKATQLNTIVWLWLGQGISTLGTGIYAIALSWEIIKVTGSAFSMGLVLFVSIFPKVVISLFAGALGDRFSKKTILLYADFIRGILSVLWGISLFFHDISLIEVYFFTLLFGIISAFFIPVYGSIIPELINGSNISRAVSINTLIFNLANVFAPAISGVFISVFSFHNIIILNGITFLLAWITNLMLPNSKPSKVEKSILRDIKEGFSYFLNQNILFWAVILITLANLAVVSYQVNLPKLIQIDMKWKPSVYGFVLSAYTLGSIVSYALFSIFRIKKKKGIIYISCLLTGGIFFSLIPLAKTSFLIAIIFFLVGAVFAVTSLISTTILYEYSDDEYRGRILGIAGMSSILSPIGLLLWGFLGDLYHSPFIFLIVSFIIVLVSIIGSFTKLRKA